MHFLMHLEKLLEFQLVLDLDLCGLRRCSRRRAGCGRRRAACAQQRSQHQRNAAQLQFVCGRRPELRANMHVGSCHVQSTSK